MRQLIVPAQLARLYSFILFLEGFPELPPEGWDALDHARERCHVFALHHKEVRYPMDLALVQWTEEPYRGRVR